MGVAGFLGNGLVNSFLGGDDSTGTLTSPEFTITHDSIHFLIGGGGFEGKTCVNLIVDGKAVRSATGPNTQPGGSEFLRPQSWKVSELRGRKAVLKIIDEAKSGWGHINVDHIVLCDGDYAWPDERESLLARAEASVGEASARAAADPSRPVVHFRPKANWMNDPNGTIYLNGYYHVFYQFNPYGDAWGHMHWGHARSRDLVHWEHLPIALWPSEAAGEEHVFSGGAALDDDAKPVLFYTSVGPNRPNEQWAARPADDNLIAWKKDPHNPILTNKLGDGLVLGSGMRDPFPFTIGDRTFMVVGADTDKESVIPIWEASNSSLSKWTERGIVWRAPKSLMEFPECPNFFSLEDRFVLLTSPYRAVEYRVGKLDLSTYRFREEATGQLDSSDQFYATNIAYSPSGERILFGWIRGFPEHMGWNGVLALPRVLTLGDDGHPRQQPIPAIKQLRRERTSFTRGEITEGTHPVGDRSTDPIEVEARLRLGTAKTVGLRLGGRGAVEIAFDGKSLSVAGHSVELPSRTDPDTIDLHVFLDRRVVEVFANEGRTVITRVVPYGSDDPPSLSVFAKGGTARVENLQAFDLAPVWNGNTPVQ
jgi:beta-fructofuranosidase